MFSVNPRLLKLRSTDTIGSITLIRTVGSGWAKISSLRRWRWDSWDTDLSLQTLQSLYSIQEQVLQLSAHQHNSTELIADASKATSPAHSTQYMVQAFPVRLNLLISNKWLKIPYFQLNYGKFHPLFWHVPATETNQTSRCCLPTTPTATSRLLFCFFGSCFLGFRGVHGLSLGLVDGWNVQPGTLCDCSLSAFLLPVYSRGCNSNPRFFPAAPNNLNFISSLKIIEDLFQWGGASCDTSGVFGASFAGGLSCMTCQSGMQPQKASVAAKKRTPYGGYFSKIGWCLWIYLGIGSRTKAIS